MDHAIEFVDLGSLGQQEAHHLCVSVLGGLVQRRVLSPVGVNVGSAGEHPEHGVALASGAGGDEGELQSLSVLVATPLLGAPQPQKRLSSPAEQTEAAVHVSMSVRHMLALSSALVLGLEVRRVRRPQHQAKQRS